MTTTGTLLLAIHIGEKTIPITFWTLFGLIGNILFSARILIQWIASERQKRTVVPVSFWWLSLAATAIFIIYAYGQLEIPFILGYAVTLVPYLRNLRIAYHPERPPRKSPWIVAAAVALGCIWILIFARQEAVRDAWFYFGLFGNAVFGSRFFVQWVQSEKRRQSVMPLSFWYLSLGGSAILLLYSIVRSDLVFILGFLFNVVPYSRNIYLIHRGRRLERVGVGNAA